MEIGKNINRELCPSLNYLFLCVVGQHLKKGCFYRNTQPINTTYYLKSSKSSSKKPFSESGFLPIKPSSFACQNLISVSPAFQHSHTSWSNLKEGKSSRPSSTLFI